MTNYFFSFLVTSKRNFDPHLPLFPYSLFFIPYSLLPISYSLFPIPYSLY
ncbi:MAG: hypothetical protein F6K65_15995 [Moorea sp. SIO3C2]|nr:hypothetical protein [Moorena sp. SIO3C2]